MNLTPSMIFSLQEISQNGFGCSKKLAKWMKEFSGEYSIGQIERNKWVLTSVDIPLLEAFLIENGYGLNPFDKEVLEQGRIETSAIFKKEKNAVDVTSDRLLVSSATERLVLNGVTMPARREFGVSVNEVLEAKVSQILVVENSEVFYRIHEYPHVISLLKKDCIIVYRGGPGHSIKAMKKLISMYSGELIGFFDYDPAGIVALGHKEIKTLILPEIGTLKERGLELDQELFQKQIYQYETALQDVINNRNELYSEYCLYLHKNRVGITQERLLALGIDLVMVNIGK